MGSVGSSDVPVHGVVGLRDRLRGGDRGIGGTVYGTVLALAALSAGSAEKKAPWTLAVLVASTAFVIWIAHVYAHGLGESIQRRRRLDWAELRGIAVRELPILAAAIPPTFALLLGAVGLLRETSAIWLAIGLGLGELAVEGARYARVERLGPFGTVVAVSANLALGGIIVALKVLVLHH
jgi:hypothetical protein